MIDDIQQHIFDSIEALSNIPQETLDNLEASAAMLSLSLPMAKVICLSSSLCTPLCNIFIERINKTYALRTSTINAIHLNTNVSQPSYLKQNVGIDSALSMEFSMLAKEGDSLLLISENNEESAKFIKLIENAHRIELPIIAIVSQADTHIKEALSDSDVLLAINSDDETTFIEVAITILNSIIHLLIDDDNAVQIDE